MKSFVVRLSRDVYLLPNGWGGSLSAAKRFPFWVIAERTAKAVKGVACEVVLLPSGAEWADDGERA